MGTGTGVIDIDASGGQSVTIYLKDNGMKHNLLGPRSFGVFNTDWGSDKAKLRVEGRAMRRTWSLISKPANVGDREIELMHDANDSTGMGWRVGDRIMIAPTTRQGSRGEGEFFTVEGIAGNLLQLDGEIGQEFMAEFKSVNGIVANMAAEVINLSRNVIISGDEFTNVPCDPDLTEDFPGEGISSEGCMCSSIRSTCTFGHHTIASMNSEATVRFTRIERGGQRGIAGKYPLHLHRMSSNEALVEGNAFDHSMQRGLVIHGTHGSTVSFNVFSDVRGAAMYIEDGNEMLVSSVFVCGGGATACGSG